MKPFLLAALLVAAPAAARDVDFADRHPQVTLRDGILTRDPFALPGLVVELEPAPAADCPPPTSGPIIACDATPDR